MSDAELTVQYLSGQMRPHHPALLEAFQRESDAAVAALHPTLDVRYGPHPRQRFDFFAATLPWRGTLAFFHAGYWQARDKAQFRFLAPTFLAQGIDVALVNYPLCPDVSLPALVEAVRPSVPAVLAHAAGLGRGGRSLVASGHSAGGQIVAELALAADPGAMSAIAALSGVFDLVPLCATPLNDKLRLDGPTAHAMSPLFRVRAGLPPALFVVGGAETAAFLDQTARMHAAWAAAGNRSRTLVVAGADHFTLLRSTELVQAMLGLF